MAYSLFKYNSQEYKYNLEKNERTLFWLSTDAWPTVSISIPVRSCKIRPISPIEKEVGYYPNAEVIINTK